MSFPPSITLEEAGLRAAVIALGANLPSAVGSPQLTLSRVLDDLQALSTRPVLASSLYRSEPEDCPPNSPEFLNAVAIVWQKQDLGARELLQRLHDLEAVYGRNRTGIVNEARSLDLDLICFGNLRLNEPDICLPHPRAHRRQFVLKPLAEIAPDLVLPGQAVTAQQLLDEIQA